LAATIASVGTVYATLFKQDIDDFLPPTTAHIVLRNVSVAFPVLSFGDRS
jgi:hypothetical protein